MQPVVETHERRDVEGRVVGRGFHHVVHAVEVAVPFRVYERDAACGVFAVFERLDTGDAVAAGEVVMIVESMKMENEVVAPEGGRIASIAVAAGSAINTGDLLFTLG